MSKEIIEQVVFGAALVESLTDSSSYHRRNLIRPNLGEKIQYHLKFAEENNQTNIVQVFSLPRDSSALDPLPSDDLEWFAFSALASLSGDTHKYWLDLLPKYQQISARVGTKIALANHLAGNHRFAGYDNPQYFDDISLIRAIAIALVHRNSRANFERDLAIDISFTHALDGLWAAYAVGELTWLLLNGASKEVALDKAIKSIPASSWLESNVNQALEVSSGARGIFDRVNRIERSIINRVPSHPTSAPETLACLFAHARFAQSQSEYLMSGYLHSRLLDSLPALHGALAALLFGEQWIPRSYLESSVELVGCSLPEMAGLPLSTLCQLIYGQST